MDPIQMLTEDHQRVKTLFGQYEQAANAQQKQQIAQNVFQELTIHSVLEKDIFYPAVREKGNQEDKQLVEHSYHDHAEAEKVIAQLKSMEASDPKYDQLFFKLRDSVLEHAQEEEDQMFPDAKKELGQDLPRLGQEMQRAKQDLQARMAA